MSVDLSPELPPFSGLCGLTMSGVEGSERRDRPHRLAAESAHLGFVQARQIGRLITERCSGRTDGYHTIIGDLRYAHGM